MVKMLNFMSCILYHTQKNTKMNEKNTHNIPTILYILNSKISIKNPKSEYHQSKSNLKDAFAMKLSPWLLLTSQEAFCLQ